MLFTGSPHAPGLNKQLEKEFENCPKIVVGNFLNNLPEGFESLVYGGTPNACREVGECIGFEVDAAAGKAIIPEIVKAAIDEKSQSKNKYYEFKSEEQKESFVERLEEERNKKRPRSESFAEKIEAEKKVKALSQEIHQK